MPPPDEAEDRSVDIWAGVECSVVRVGDRIVDEIVLTGHGRRKADVERIADLGVRAVRYPVLWERHPGPIRGRFDWGWSDRRLKLLRGVGVPPVVGLLHQGTGRWGEVLEPGFPAAFGAYAEQVARRYAWIDSFLPVNEPLTTARFAGWYGHWYPHAHDDRVFARILVSEILAYRAAARAIRRVRPHATIVVSDDISVTLSTPKLRAQADFDNDRRWLALDLELGRVDRGHPLRGWLERDGGIDARTLDEIAADPEPPDLVGVHHYLTSDRFLDHRIERYPGWTWGGNGRVAYADVELIRVLAADRDGVGDAVGRTWDRYRLPIALTEVHLGGPVHERRAWWREAVASARGSADRGVDLRAVTTWSVFGSWEWASLLTRVDGHYEAGAFDLRSGHPRPTALARDVVAASRGREMPPLAPGWWRRPDRLLYPPVGLDGRDLGAMATSAMRPAPVGWPATIPDDGP